MSDSKHPVLAALASGLSGLALLVLGIFFTWITFYVAESEVWPAILGGSLNVQTNSMILNILWEGNEIYIILALYLLLAAGFIFSAFVAFRAALSRL